MAMSLHEIMNQFGLTMFELYIGLLLAKSWEITS